MDIDLAIAANKVILTTERIVSNDQIRRAPDQTKIPLRSMPSSSCRSDAPRTNATASTSRCSAMQDYVGLVNKDPVKGMQQYLERFVYGPKSWNDFLAMIGTDELLEAARAGEAFMMLKRRATPPSCSPS